MALDKKYLSIVKELGFSVGDDRKARDLLDSMIPHRDWRDVEKGLAGRDVIVFGCGPSLAGDVDRLKESGLLVEFVLFAVDGAVKALLERGLIPNFNVTDLDGDDESTIAASRYGCITIVHAHGDNTRKLRSIVPKLEGVVYGTTQVEPTKKLKNLGGFTDGDRAVYLVEHFRPRRILLAGMDFGKVVGFYSGAYDEKKKIRKLAIGKRLIEELAAKSKTEILNLTSGGVDIKNVRRIALSELSKQDKA